MVDPPFDVPTQERSGHGGSQERRERRTIHFAEPHNDQMARHERLRLGLIGAGGVTVQHLPALQRLGRTELVGVVSRTHERAAALAATWGATVHEDIESLLDRGLDVCLICVPPNRNPDACLAVARRGVPFLAEKPLAGGRVDAGPRPDDVAREVERRDVVAAIGYQWRALDFLPSLREQFAVTPPRLVLARWLGNTPGPSWWQREDEGGGQVVEQATHQYDLVRALLGDGVVRAAASGRHDRAAYPDADVADVGAALIEFPGGAIASFTNTCILGSGQVELQFCCDGLLATIRQIGTWPDFRWTLTYDEAGASRTLETRRDPYEVQAESFLDAVSAGDPRGVICSYADALATDRLTRAVVAAAGVAD